MHQLASQTHHEEHVKKGYIEPLFTDKLCTFIINLCVVNAVPHEITSFTDKMRIRYRLRDIVQP